MGLPGQLRRVLYLLLLVNATALVFANAWWCSATATMAQEVAQNAASSRKASGPLGTIKSISGNTLVLTSDSGTEVTVAIQEYTKFVRVAPGQKDLRDAQPIQIGDLQIGDRILVRGETGEGGKTVVATSVIAMKKADIADKQSRERDEWQKTGVGGWVNSVDAAGETISITVPSAREKKTVAIHISKQTVLRRYTPGSVKFDDAHAAPLEQINPGDQLRARGTKNSDGSELAAEEIVSGNFRNISGTISGMNATQNSITVRDLVTKKSVMVKITGDSQLRKLPAAMALRIAVRLNGSSGGAGTAQAVPGAAARPIAKGPASPEDRQPDSRDSNGEVNGGVRKTAGVGLGGGSDGAGGSPDLQQMISRMPAATISDLHPGDAVMLVATEGTRDSVTAITLLAGVEPILQSSPNGVASTILSPWSLNGAPSGDAGTP